MHRHTPKPTNRTRNITSLAEAMIEPKTDRLHGRGGTKSWRRHCAYISGGDCWSCLRYARRLVEIEFLKEFYVRSRYFRASRPNNIQAWFVPARADGPSRTAFVSWTTSNREAIYSCRRVVIIPPVLLQLLPITRSTMLDEDQNIVIYK